MSTRSAVVNVKGVGGAIGGVSSVGVDFDCVTFVKTSISLLNMSISLGINLVIVVEESTRTMRSVSEGLSNGLLGVVRTVIRSTPMSTTKPESVRMSLEGRMMQ